VFNDDDRKYYTHMAADTMKAVLRAIFFQAPKKISEEIKQKREEHQIEKTKRQI